MARRQKHSLPKARPSKLVGAIWAAHTHARSPAPLCVPARGLPRSEGKAQQMLMCLPVSMLVRLLVCLLVWLLVCLLVCVLVSLLMCLPCLVVFFLVSLLVCLLVFLL
uniref:Uncharacterized protein n=1 Tax=Ixodes ricinus TaxID=34613 RepID=A0A6B0UH07_IXORI